MRIDHIGGVSTAYCHASLLIVRVGQQVVAGEVIAHVGSTGNSTGPHLHLELHVNGEPTDPIAYLAARGVDI